MDQAPHIAKVGEVKLQPETIACTNLEEAKVFVKVDTSKVLPKEITFTKELQAFHSEVLLPLAPCTM